MRLAWILAAALAGCGGSGFVRVRGVAPLNVDASGASTPVDVRLYLLKDDGRFARARAEELWTRDAEVLGGDLLGQRKITVYAGLEGDAAKVVDIGPLAEGCRFLGVLALYATPDEKGPRHLVIPAERVRGRVLRFSGSHVRLDD